MLLAPSPLGARLHEARDFAESVLKPIFQIIAIRNIYWTTIAVSIYFPATVEARWSPQPRIQDVSGTRWEKAKRRRNLTGSRDVSEHVAKKLRNFEFAQNVSRHPDIERRRTADCRLVFLGVRFRDRAWGAAHLGTVAVDRDVANYWRHGTPVVLGGNRIRLTSKTGSAEKTDSEHRHESGSVMDGSIPT